MIRITDGYENDVRNTAISRLPDENPDPRTINDLMEVLICRNS